MKRIMVIGFSGAGKSTLTRRLGNLLDIEPTHMDRIQWLPGWVANTQENKREILSRVLERDSWIIDGTYGGTMWKERTEKADTILFLDFNRILCLYRAIKRRITYRNRTRPDMGEGCKEKIDFEFFKWVVWDGRKKRKQHYAFLKTWANGTDRRAYIFKRPKDLEKFLQDMEDRKNEGTNELVF